MIGNSSLNLRKPFIHLLSSLFIINFFSMYAVPVRAASIIYTFPTSSEQTQTQTFTLPTDLVSLNSVQVNTGNVTYSVEDGKIKITVSNGDVISKESFYNDKLHLLPDYTATIYSENNDFKDTITYETTDGYSGFLSLVGQPYVSSGEVISGAQMNVSITQKSPENNFPDTILYDEDSFKGILSKNGSPTKIKVSGGTHTKDTKTATSTLDNSNNSFSSTLLYDDGNYRGTLSKLGASTKYVASGSYTEAKNKDVTQNQTSTTNSFPNTVSYSDGSGYSGTLSKDGVATASVISNTRKSLTVEFTIAGLCDDYFFWDADRKIWLDGVDGVVAALWTVPQDGEFPLKSGDFKGLDIQPAFDFSTSVAPNAATHFDVQFKKDGYTYYGRVNNVPGSAAGCDTNNIRPTHTGTKHMEVSTIKGTMEYRSFKGTLYTNEAPKSLDIEIELSEICNDHFFWDEANQKWLDGVDGYVNANYVRPAEGEFPLKSGEFIGLDIQPGFDLSTAVSPNNATKYDVQITKDGYTYYGTLKNIPGAYSTCETPTRPTHKGSYNLEKYSVQGVSPYRGFAGTLYTEDTRKYQYTQKYSGTVTKPAVDTRVYAYKQTYSGEATRYLKITETLQSETDSFPSSITYEDQNGYKGTLSKYGDAILDEDVYEQSYTGYIYSQTVDNTEYEYSQLYNGTVNQESDDNRVWAADYTGTLYKGGEDYTNHQYSYTVTLDYGTEKTSKCSYLGISPSSISTLNYVPKCTTLDNGSEDLYSFFYDFKVTGISNIQVGK